MILPEPRYKIGNHVFFPEVLVGTERLACPDCLGTLKWKAVLPSGAELELNCPRCNVLYSHNPLPELKQVAYTPVAKPLTIGSIRIDTAERDGQFVHYMCQESGIGSGSVYREGQLFDSEEGALSVARFHCAERRTADVVRDLDLVKKFSDRGLNLGAWNFTDARIEQEKLLQRKYKWQLQDVQQILFREEGVSDQEKVTELKVLLETVDG